MTFVAIQWTDRPKSSPEDRENPLRTPIRRPGIERDVVSCVNEIVSSSSCLQVFNGLSGRPVDEWSWERFPWTGCQLPFKPCILELQLIFMKEILFE